MNSSAWSAAALTDVGLRRKNNEDSILSMPAAGIFCVADGMGGAREGHVASKAVTDAIEEAVNSKAASGVVLSFSDKVSLVREAVSRVNTWIQQRKEERGFTQMGSTLTICVFDEKNISRGIVLHAGDSRLYCYRGLNLKQITTDHSFAAELNAKSEAALPAEFRNVITKAVGLQPTLKMDEVSFEVQNDDLFLLCSDGLTRLLADKFLLKLIRQNTAENIENLARILVNEAKKAGGDDNISVVLVRIAVKTKPLAPALGRKIDELSQKNEEPETANTATEEPVVDVTTPTPDDSTGKTTPRGVDGAHGRVVVEGHTPHTIEKIPDQAGRKDIRPGPAAAEAPQEPHRGSKAKVLVAVIALAVIASVFLVIHHQGRTPGNRSAPAKIHPAQPGHKNIASLGVSSNVRPQSRPVAIAAAPPPAVTVPVANPQTQVVAVLPLATAVVQVAAQAPMKPPSTVQPAVSASEGSAPAGVAIASPSAVQVTALGRASARTEVPPLAAATATTATVTTTVKPETTAVASVSTLPLPSRGNVPAVVPVSAETGVVILASTTETSRQAVAAGILAAREATEEVRVMTVLNAGMDNALRTGRWGALKKDLGSYAEKLDRIAANPAQRQRFSAWLEVWKEAAQDAHLGERYARNVKEWQALCELMESKPLPPVTFEGGSEERADAYCRSCYEQQTVIIETVDSFVGKEDRMVGTLGDDYPQAITNLWLFTQGASSLSDAGALCRNLADIRKVCAAVKKWTQFRLAANTPLTNEDYPRDDLLKITQQGDATWGQLYMMIQPLDQQLAFSRARADEAANMHIDKIAVLQKNIVIEHDRAGDIHHWRSVSNPVYLRELLTEINGVVPILLGTRSANP